MGFASFKENMPADWPYAPDYDKSLFGIINFVNAGSTFVVTDPKNPKFINGVLVLSENTVWWSTQPIISSILYYVKPDKRTFKVAKALIHEAQKYGILKGLPLVFDFFAQKDVDRKKKLLRFLGFEDYGSFMVFLPK